MMLDRAEDLAKFLNVSTAAVRKWTRLTNLPRVSCGRAVRYDRAQVLAWFAAGGPRKNGKKAENKSGAK